MPIPPPDENLNLLSDLVARARAAGADAADAVMFESASTGVSYRLGALEDVERSESRDLGLRVFVGRRPAVVSTTDASPAHLAELVERVVAMARNAPEDKYAGLAPADLLANGPHPELDLFDATEMSSEKLVELAARCEDAARAAPGITNSEGAGASASASSIALVTSTGFAGAYRGSGFSVSVSVLAGAGTEMERDYDYDSKRHLADLMTPETIGQSAAERTLRRLNPRKASTAQVPVVFDPRAATSLLGHFAGAISGNAITRGTSFLKDHLGKPVFGPGITIVDDPHRRRGLASKPFDGEGVKNGPVNLIEDGDLTTWLLDSASARQLGLACTGHASRGTGGPPGPSATNLHLAAGKATPAELMADIQQGLYVTELIGMGVNGVTGDYSRGASGFWIENGELTWPVSEITIAGNLIPMFLALVPANDLEFRRGVNSPTVRIDGLTLAGA